MLVRRYIVREMPEAVVKIRKELGKNAVILSTKRVVVRRWFGLWRMKRIEVLAAVGDDIPVQVHAPNPSTEKVTSQGNANVTTQALEAAASLATEFGAGQGTERSADDQVSTDTQTKLLADNLSELKTLLAAALSHTTGPHAPIVQQLIHQGVREEAALSIVNSAIQEDGASVRPDGQNAGLVTSVLSRLDGFATARPIDPTSRVVALVGPTGVGKTTTIAKLAALQVLAGRKRVGLITADTYRIAAVEQLRTYAGILGIPLEVVYHPSDIEGAMGRLEDRDLVLVDTAGRSFRTDALVQELDDLLAPLKVDETYLVLALTAKPQDLNLVTDLFCKHMQIDKFLFTKMDETSTYGAILDLLLTFRKPLSYITNGQNVPDDIEIPTVDALLKLIFGGAA